MHTRRISSGKQRFEIMLRENDIAIIKGRDVHVVELGDADDVAEHRDEEHIELNRRAEDYARTKVLGRANLRASRFILPRTLLCNT